MPADSGRATQAAAFTTVLGPLTLERACYHCAGCRRGTCPRDRTLGLQATSLSPATTGMVGLTAAEVGFTKAGEPLAVLAGVGALDSDLHFVRVFASSPANSWAGRQPIPGTCHAWGYNEIGIEKLMILYFTSTAPISVNCTYSIADREVDDSVPTAAAREFGPSAQAIRTWVVQADRDVGKRSERAARRRT